MMTLSPMVRKKNKEKTVRKKSSKTVQKKSSKKNTLVVRL